MVGTYAQHVPGGGSSDGGPGTGFGTAFGSPNAGAMLQHTSNKIHKIPLRPTIYSKQKTNKTHTTFKNCCFRLRLAVVLLVLWPVMAQQKLALVRLLSSTLPFVIP